MNTYHSFQDRLYNFQEKDFEGLCMDIYRYQASNNPVFRDYHEYLGKDPNEAAEVEDLVFLPIELFKYHSIQTGKWEPEAVFRSSGTTGMIRSEHKVRDLDFYKNISRRNFELFYGPVADYHILALLPSYLERNDSSLVAMTDHLIRESQSEFSGFYLREMDELLADIEKIRKVGDRKVLLLGVSFALLDLSEYAEIDLSDALIMETGGMKGRREELTRSQLHEVLSRAFNNPLIHSEYGMTELLSQAYSVGNGKFSLPPWMKIRLREVNDPFSNAPEGGSGGMNVIDLANIHSCAFIETKDLGKLDSEDQLEILGRYDNSDIRGCNLMVN